MSQKQFVRWSKDCAENHKLIELFNLFDATNGQAGADPNLSSPAQIRLHVYDKYAEDFKRVNKSTFSTNYRKTAAQWKINKDITTGRKGK